MGKAMTWEKGRQLKSCGVCTYGYNANGIRTKKTVLSNHVTYHLDGTKILREKRGVLDMVPLYDHEDSVCGLTVGGAAYYFQKNLQGDIIGIVDENGAVVARYRYDAWGACTIVADTSSWNIATINPFRYRGYYLDSESGLYYLQSRYYDPNTGRFINGDSVPQVACLKAHSINSNMFTYCINDPIGNLDFTGRYAITVKLVSAVIAAFSGAYIGAAIAKHFNLTGWAKKLCVVGGASLMGLVGWYFPLVNLYAAVKEILYIVGYTYLTSKKYTIAAMAYKHGMWGMGKQLSTAQKNAFIAAILTASEYKKSKKELISKIKSGKKAPFKIIEFTNTKDLYYAIQHMSMMITYNTKKKKYVVTMSDTYDFTEWRKVFSKTGASFANAANNLGYVMQKCGMMIPYNIRLSFEVSG